ncbi:hypothetical protein ABMA10_18730 [Plantibacter sp. RU18]
MVHFGLEAFSLAVGEFVRRLGTIADDAVIAGVSFLRPS